MVRASYDQKPYRRLLMEAYGATVHPSPSDVTSAGRAVLEQHPDSTGSLGIAISEAVEVAGGDPDARYALGSVLNHVLLHQTVIGEEAIKQLAMAGGTPDLIVGCTGGGANFSRPVLPVRAAEARGPDEPGAAGGRAGRVPVLHPWRLRLRLRRHRRVHPAAQDAHARARFRAGPDPRGRAALPRHVSAAVAHLRAEPDRGGGQAAVGVLRGGGAGCPGRGGPPGAGAPPPRPPPRPGTA